MSGWVSDGRVALCRSEMKILPVTNKKRTHYLVIILAKHTNYVKTKYMYDLKINL